MSDGFLESIEEQRQEVDERLGDEVRKEIRKKARRGDKQRRWKIRARSTIHKPLDIQEDTQNLKREERNKQTNKDRKYETN